MLTNQPCDVFLVQAIVNSKIHKQWIVKGIRHFDPTGTGQKFADMVGEKHIIAKGCEHALNRIKSLNHVESQEGEPLYPPKATLTVEPLEFEVAGIQEI